MLMRSNDSRSERVTHKTLESLKTSSTYYKGVISIIGYKRLKVNQILLNWNMIT